MTRSVQIIALTVLTSGLLGSCGIDPSAPPTGGAAGDPGRKVRVDRGFDRDVPQFSSDPGDFVRVIDNPYLGFEPGKVFRYAGKTKEGLETIVVEVTHQTKPILDVTTTVVHDRAYLDGKLIEDTVDWYAQDADGNVWYFGEDSKQIKDGQVVGTEGSWEAGVDEAMPGIIMLAEPEAGTRYQQEFAEGVAEDMAKVVSVSETVEIALGTFVGCLKTLEWTPLDRGAREYKFYAPGTGLILETSRGGKGESIELTVQP